MANKNLLALAAGLGTGYMAAGERARAQAKEDEDRQMRKTEFDQRQAEFQRQKDERMTLADATRPAVVNDGTGVTLETSGRPVLYSDPGVANSDYRQAKTMGLADVKAPDPGISMNGKPFGTADMAQAAAAAYDDPAAQNERAAQGLRKIGSFDKALALENATLNQRAAKLGIQKTTAELDAYKLEQAKKLRREGMDQVAVAARSGDPMKIQQAMNAEGEWKLPEPPTVTPYKRKLDGYGEVTDYKIEGTAVGPNGETKPYSTTMHDLNFAILPYKDQLELLRKGGDSETKAAAALTLAEARLTNAATNAEKVAAQAEIARLKSEATGAKGEQNLSREERMRYTSLFTEAGRRLTEAQKALGTLQKDPLFMTQASRAGTPQAAQLAEAQQAIKDHNEERAMFQGLLAGSQTKKPEPAMAGDAPVAVKTAAERDKLPKGARYTAPNGQVYIKQ